MKEKTVTPRELIRKIPSLQKDWSWVEIERKIYICECGWTLQPAFIHCLNPECEVLNPTYHQR